MGHARSIPRRRVVSLAGAGLAALTGCTDDGAGPDDADEGDETEPEGVEDDEEALPEAEGTNVLVEVVDEEDGTPVPGVVVTVTGGGFDGEEFETGPDGGVVLRDVEPDDYTFAAATGEGDDEETVSIEEGEDATVTLAVPVPEEG
jgi:hypothetical protein